MRRMDLRILAVLWLFVAAGGCKNQSGSGSAGSGSTGGGSTGGSVTLTFPGALDARPTGDDTVRVEWSVATNSAGDPASAMRYSVYRATTRDLSDEVLIVDRGTGNSLDDAGLIDDITYFYRIEAHDPAGNTESAATAVSAHLPWLPPTPIDYATQVEPLWFTVVASDGKTVCVDCHDASQPYGFLSLATWERVIIGTGTPDKPDGLIIEGDGERSAQQFEDAYFGPNAPREHWGWRFRREFFLPETAMWINEGALSEPDLSRPEFDFVDMQNKARYSATDNGDGTVFVNFPHAWDPESQPLRKLADHLKYHVYGGPDSNSIDWRNPVAVLDRYQFPWEEQTAGVLFDWAYPTGVFVVRAYDYTRNASLNEREVSLDD